jgi:hemolysin activation/secretion protein
MVFTVKFHLKNSLSYCICLNLTLLAHDAVANTSDVESGAAREAIRLQQIQEEQRKVLEAKAISPVKDSTKLNVETPKIEQKESNVCFDVEEVKINFTTLIDADDVLQLKHKYENKCIDSNLISTLMSELTFLYIKKGYVAARVYLPAQDIKNSKKLILNVDEGKLSKITKTKNAQKTISIKTAAPFLVGKPLNLKDLEQALDQYNRLQSNNVTMQIEPGEKNGESIVVFDNKPTKRINGYFSFDNKGQDSTGRQQASLGLGVDNIFGLNDLLSLSYSRSLPFEQSRKDSAAYSAFYVVPLGYHTFSASASRSNYDTTVITPFQALHSMGKTESYSLKMDSLLYRGDVTQIRSSFGLTTKDNKAYLEDVLLGVGSRKLTVADLGVSFSTQKAMNFFNGYLTYQKGLKLLNSLEDENNLDKENPKAQFDKFLYGITYFKPFELLNQKLTFTSSFNGQESLDVLYGSEQYSIGSLYTVRGFNQKTISGDEGYSLKNDLALNKAYELGNGTVFAKYYLGADYGRVKNKYGSELVGELSSASLGATFNFHNVSIELIATQPIYQPDFLEQKEADFFFSTTFTF